MIEAYKQFRVYIHGTKFTVVTDHASLRWLQNLKEPEGSLAQWALKLQPYNFKIIHRAGSKHQNADGLSQLPTVTHLESQDEHLFNFIINPEGLEAEPESIQKSIKNFLLILYLKTTLSIN